MAPRMGVSHVGGTRLSGTMAGAAPQGQCGKAANQTCPRLGRGLLVRPEGEHHQDHCRAHGYPTDKAQILCDASPWGLGAVLCINGVAVQRLDSTFSALDHEMMGTVEGVPDYQATFEACAILVAARTWLPLWQDRPTSICMQSDSLAALGAAAKMGSTVPALNTITRELALDLAEGNYEMQWFGHLPGTLNTWADSLSRLSDPNGAKDVPEALRHVPRADLAPRTRSWWRASGSPSAR